MQKQFNHQFITLFNDSQSLLEKSLNQKVKAIKNIDNYNQVLDAKEY